MSTNRTFQSVGSRIIAGICTHVGCYLTRDASGQPANPGRPTFTFTSKDAQGDSATAHVHTNGGALKVAADTVARLAAVHGFAPTFDVAALNKALVGKPLTLLAVEQVEVLADGSTVPAAPQVSILTVAPDAAAAAASLDSAFAKQA